MPLKKGLVLLLAIIILGALLAGCSSNTGSKEQVLRLWEGGEPETMDPAKSTGVPEANYLLAIFEGLTSLDAQGLPIPAAAEKWDISPDGSKYTFHLRKNARWTNGDPVTAQDFEYSWKRLLSPQLAAEYAYMLFSVKGAEAYNNNQGTLEQVGVKALDDKTLEVTLEKPTAYFLAIVAHASTYPVNKKVIEAAGTNWAGEVGTLISNGPFKVSEWIHGSKLTMVKNDQYWDKDKVKISKLEWALLEVNTTAMNMFDNKQLDYMRDPPMTEVDRLRQESKLQLGNYLGTYYYELNNKKPPFDNPKIRRAFSLAIDRDSLVKNVLKDIHKPATGWIPPGFTDPVTMRDFTDESDKYIKTNVGEAKRLLAEAGYPEGKGLPPIALLFNTNDNHKAIAEAVQEMWKKNLGINVELQNQEWKVFLQTRKSGEFQIARAGWIGDYPDPMTFSDYFLTNGGNNWGKYSNPAYDRLIAIAQASNDQNVRMKVMHEAEKDFINDMGVIPVYFYSKPYCLSPQVKGIVAVATGLVNYKDAYIDQ